MKTYFSQYNDEIINYNHVIVDKPFDNPFELHTHDICEFLFFRKGDASVIIGDKNYKLKKDDLVIFRPNIPHKIFFESNMPYERYDILFDENKLANNSFMKVAKNINLISCSGNSAITELFTKMDRYYNYFSENDLKLLITNIVEELIYNLQLLQTDTIEGDNLTMHPVITKAVEYINAHYCEPLNLDDICKEISITKSHLHHLFIENLKITPKKFINMKRLSKAQKLICTGEKPCDIYKICGYNDYVTFFRNYTSLFGYTPSDKDKIIVERKIES